MKTMTKDDVTAKLKQAIKLRDARIYRLRRQGVDVTYPKGTYRTAFGPYKVRDGVFARSRFYFDPSRLTATSYSWWSMLMVRNGKLIRNRCRYSMQTSQHQSTLDHILETLGIKPDLVVYTRAPINDLARWRDQVLTDFADAVVRLNHCQRKSKKMYASLVRGHEKEMTKLTEAKIGLRFTKKDKALYVTKAEQRRVKNLAWDKERKVRDAAYKLEREQRRAIAVNESFQVETKPTLTLIK